MVFDWLLKRFAQGKAALWQKATFLCLEKRYDLNGLYCKRKLKLFKH